MQKGRASAWEGPWISRGVCRHPAARLNQNPRQKTKPAVAKGFQLAEKPGKLRDIWGNLRKRLKP